MRDTSIAAFDKPFRHWYLKDVVDPQLIAMAKLEIPSPTNPNWIRYANDLEFGKWAMERGLPSAWRELLSALAKLPLENLSGVAGLQSDLRGGGLQLLFPGGWLAPHLDYALHPSGLERRLNVILFLDSADPNTGGELQLCDPLGEPVVSITPEENCAAIFECGDLSFHGVAPIMPQAKPRLTAAAYFLAPPRPGITRRRAMFLPKR